MGLDGPAVGAAVKQGVSDGIVPLGVRANSLKAHYVAGVFGVGSRLG